MPSSISHPNPWSAVIADLTAPAGERPPLSIDLADPKPVSVIDGHPFSARPDTIQCIKQKAIPHHRLYMVTFQDSDAAASCWRHLIGVEEDPTGWTALGSAGGRGTPILRAEHPWVNLAGWWGHDRFCAGGHVLSAPDITHVRLTTRDGMVLDDDTEDDVVLFLTDHTVEPPVTLELLNATGQIVASQLAVEVPE